MMLTGSITANIDVAQVVLYIFWVFFACLIFYLQRENRREGYPLHTDGNGTQKPMLPIYWPPSKTYLLSNGETKVVPDGVGDARPVKAAPTAPWRGAPLEPTGDPMKDAVGPASFAERADVPDVTAAGAPRIVPMRSHAHFHVDERDPNPIGMSVVGADGAIAGTVTDIWVDQSESLARYLEVQLSGQNARSVLLPFTCARIDARGKAVKVYSILASQFAGVPGIAIPNQVTRREEDRICGYYGGGHLYATPRRAETCV